MITHGINRQKCSSTRTRSNNNQNVIQVSPIIYKIFSIRVKLDSPRSVYNVYKDRRPFVSKSQRKLNHTTMTTVYAYTRCVCLKSKRRGHSVVTSIELVNASRDFTLPLIEHTNSCTMHKWAGSRLFRLSFLVFVRSLLYGYHSV